MDLNKVGDTQAQADNLFMTQQTAILLRNPLLNKSSPPQQEAAEAEAEEAHAYTNAHGGLAVLPFKKGLKVAVIGPHGNATKVRVEKQERRPPFAF